MLVRCATATVWVAPGRLAGRGLKLSAVRCRRRSYEVAPGRLAGRGLKRALPGKGLLGIPA